MNIRVSKRTYLKSKSDYGKSLINYWGWGLVAVFFVVTLIYIVVTGDGLFIEVHDNLDSNIATYKMLKDDSLFWTFGTKAPMLGGIDRNYLYSDLKLYSWLHMVFPSFIAIIIAWYLKIGLSIAGFFLLGHTIYGGKRNNVNIFVSCGLLYGILPTFPTAAFGFASLPLILLLLIKVYRESHWKYVFALFFTTVLSTFSLFGIFICGYTLVVFLADWICRKKPKWFLLYSIISISLGFVLTEWRLFYIALFSQEETIRSTFVSSVISSGDVIQLFLEALIKGYYHCASLHTIVVLPVCMIYFVTINIRYIKGNNINGFIKEPFNWLVLWQLTNCMFYAINDTEWFKALMGAILPPLRGFQFSRTLWFSPFIWYFSFMMILCRVSWKHVLKIFLIIFALITVCTTPSRYNHILYNGIIACSRIVGTDRFEAITGLRENKDSLSFREFYSSKLFKTIQEDIGYDGEWSIAYGIHPAILIYNDIKTLDGYYSLYPKAYKIQFRKLIQPELDVDPSNASYFDTWGGRAYIFSKEIGFAPERTQIVKEAELLIDPVVFREMNGKYIFSKVSITNADELGFYKVGSYSDDESPYTIHVYTNDISRTIND